jgi:hypothetical protein
LEEKKNGRKSVMVLGSADYCQLKKIEARRGRNEEKM